jgi:hypothetical protein
MRLQHIPKQAIDGNGEVFGILVFQGHEPLEFQGKTLEVRRLYYEGVGYMKESFTTTESDTLWLAYVVEAWLNAGGKLSQLSRMLVGNYKRYKFHRTDKGLLKWYRRAQKKPGLNVSPSDSESVALASAPLPESLPESVAAEGVDS